MKKNGILWIVFMLCLYFCGCGSPDRGQEAQAKNIQQDSQAAQDGMQEHAKATDRDAEATGNQVQEGQLIDMDREKAESVKAEIEDIRSMTKEELAYDSDLSDEEEEIYKDEHGNSYSYNDVGEVIDFTANTENLNSRAVKPEEEEVQKAADLYLENLVEDPSYYQMDRVEYNIYVNLYLVLYRHKIGDVDTGDIVLLTLDNGLNLASFSIPRAYAFQEMDGAEIDVEKIKQQALDQYYQNCGDSVSDVKIEGFLVGTDDKGAMGYNVDICGKKMMDGEDFDMPLTIFIPASN